MFALDNTFEIGLEFFGNLLLPLWGEVYLQVSVDKAHGTKIIFLCKFEKIIDHQGQTWRQFFQLPLAAQTSAALWGREAVGKIVAALLALLQQILGRHPRTADLCGKQAQHVLRYKYV